MTDAEARIWWLRMMIQKENHALKREAWARENGEQKQ